MLGFEGPFRFAIEETGTKIPWEALDEQLRDELTYKGKHTRSNSDVYMCRIAVAPDESRRQKHHDWEKVKRVYIEVKPGSKGISICGISPRDKKIGQLDQTEMALLKTLSGTVKLFNTLELTLNVPNPVAVLARKDRYAVMSSCNRDFAQWVFSEGWEKIGFELFLYVLVPTSAPAENRFVEVSVKPTWKKNKFLSQASVWRKKVLFA